MNKKCLNRLAALIIISGLMAACGSPPMPAPASAAAPTQVKLMLDWVPNVNHTGIYVAQANGYFQQANLQVDIVQPGEVYAEQAVAGGAVDFGISFQEQVTISRSQGVPLVSIAAIIQHNTSGFAALASKRIGSPADWNGLTYGSFGSPFEEPTLRSLMTCAGGDYSTLKIADIGFSDPLALLSQDKIDLAWIFYGAEGIASKQQGLNLDIVMMDQFFDCVPDYYTPVLIASQDTVTKKPQLVRAFVGAVSRGYRFAIQNPDQAAGILQRYAPESDLALLQAQQVWLSPRYQADAARWGEQSLAIWRDYADWMITNSIIQGPFDAQAAFTNDFLPQP
jgi:ABC-type nitrate/sulfonate/bicarbonate transport system substrate-binding protein